MKKPVMLDGTLCLICHKRIQPNEPCDWTKTKKKPQKTLWFHTKCYENLKKKG